MSITLNTQDLHIPARPAILEKLQHAVTHTDLAPESFANIIVHDVGLSAAVLSAVNAPHFGLKSHISDIKQAAILLGPKHLTHIITYYALRQSISKASPSVPLTPLWEQADRIAMMSIKLARELDIRIPDEDIHAAALFHDCGVAVLALSFKNYDAVLAKSMADSNHSVTYHEEQLLGVSRSEAGYQLAKRWFMPSLIQNVIYKCYDRNAISQAEDKGTIICLIKAAGQLNAKQKGADMHEWDDIRDKVLKCLSISPSKWERIEETFLNDT